MKRPDDTQDAPLTSAEAEARGFEIDLHCYPWVAYKGPRFKSDEWHPIFTDLEAGLIAVCKLMMDDLAKAEIGSPFCKP